jgi:hypothetical protein
MVKDIMSILILMNIKIIFKCHMSPYNWPSQMNTCQNLIHILLDGRGIIKLLIMMNIEIRFKCHVSPWATHVE